MKHDVSTNEDIRQVVLLFYDKVKQDALLKSYFTEIIPIDWERHIPTMCSFWENVLFYTGNFNGNPLSTHKRIHLLKQTNATHFEQWLFLFYQSIDELYIGKNAEKMKTHAASIAQIMQLKIKL